jgi:hypothetical protein
MLYYLLYSLSSRQHSAGNRLHHLGGLVLIDRCIIVLEALFRLRYWSLKHSPRSILRLELSNLILKLGDLVTKFLEYSSEFTIIFLGLGLGFGFGLRLGIKVLLLHLLFLLLLFLLLVLLFLL